MHNIKKNIINNQRKLWDQEAEMTNLNYPFTCKNNLIFVANLMSV